MAEPGPAPGPEPNLQTLAGIMEMLRNLTTITREGINTQRGMGIAIERLNDRQNAQREAADRNRPDKVTLDFMKNCPTFERGKDRWADFADWFTFQKNTHEIDDRYAKIALWGAIHGRSSRLVITSMKPNVRPYEAMDFAEYLQAMGNKFTPATESLQMKSEYKGRVQGKNEDVQNYITEKYELFKVAYPNVEDLSDFYIEATKGVANKYVRNNLWGLRAT